MGEVRVKVMLRNAADVALANTGRISASEVRSYEADAVVDTGAVSLVVPQHVVDVLGLGIAGHKVVEYADGRKDAVDRAGPIEAEIMQRSVFTEALVLGDEVLIGQVVLEQTDLHVDCLNQRLVPNPAHPDQPVIKIK